MRHAAVLLLCLSTCSSQPVTFAGQTRPDRGTCDPPTSATLVIRGTDFLFAPASGTILLRGKLDGDVLASTLTLVGADRKLIALDFRARHTPSTITGVYTTPRCRYAVVLRATQD